MSYIPLMNALKTFVVAGKCLNFTKAADELLVSPSAVSHQIKILEEYLGVRLFSRNSRRMFLTDEGKQLYISLDEPFKAIASAVKEVTSSKSQQNLHIALRPFFSVSWLAPRLKRFWGSNPDIQVDLIHRNSVPDFVDEKVDAAILWGKGDWEGVEAELLIPGELTPICSPGLVEELGYPHSVDDLKRYTLIHDTDYQPWSEWLGLAQATEVDPTQGLIFDDTNVRVQSILNDQGVMLGCPTLLQQELEEGSLVRLFDLVLPDYAYYAVYPAAMAPGHKTRLFLEWLSSEAAEH